MKLKLMVCALLLCLTAVAQSDPWPASAIIAPEKLAARIQGNEAPYILYVGFPILYKGAHISKAVFAGPCSKSEGLQLLTESVKSLSKDEEIILYCGCCPFAKCPNIRPAYKALEDAGFTKVKVLQLDTNLHTDWIEKGYPTEKP